MLPYIFQGQVVSTYRYYGRRKHVVNVDWEDVAVGPGVRMPGDKGMPGNAIFINDGGADNGGPANNIYVFPEVEHPFVNRTATSVKRLQYRYVCFIDAGVTPKHTLQLYRSFSKSDWS